MNLTGIIRKRLPVYTDEQVLSAMDEIALTGRQVSHRSIRDSGFRVDNRRMTRLQTLHRKRLQGPVPELTKSQREWLAIEGHRANAILAGLERLYRDIQDVQTGNQIREARESDEIKRQRAFPLGLRVVYSDQISA